MVGIPIGVGVVRIIPTFVFAIVVPVAFVASFMLLLALVLSIVVVVVAILMRGGDRQRSCQSHENHSC